MKTPDKLDIVMEGHMKGEAVGEKKKDPPLPTFIICSTLAYNCTFAANLHHIPLPGEALRRSANSRWNMSTAVRIMGRWERSLNTRGEEIWGWR